VGIAQGFCGKSRRVESVMNATCWLGNQDSVAESWSQESRLYFLCNVESVM
jgi:hypothetical protein